MCKSIYAACWLLSFDNHAACLHLYTATCGYVFVVAAAVTSSSMKPVHSLKCLKYQIYLIFFEIIMVFKDLGFGI